MIIRKLKTLTLRMLIQQWRSLVGSCSAVGMKAISECRARPEETTIHLPAMIAQRKIQTHQQFIILPSQVAFTPL